MTIQRTVYTSEDLLGVMRELDPTPAFWLRWFPTLFRSETGRIEWSKIPASRRLAPFVVPTVPGRPTWQTQEDLYQVQPAYIKAKDPVTPTSLMNRQAGFGELGQARALTPEERYNATVAAILQYHRDIIERRWEWLAAMALINARVTLAGDGYPAVTIDFLRAPNQTVSLSGSARWDQANVDIPGNIEAWMTIMTRARFGGAPADMLMGGDVWEEVRKNEAVLKLLDLNTRGTTGQVDIGVGDGTRYQYKGTLNGSLRMWLYSDYYEDEAGTQQLYLPAKDVLLLAPPAAVQGVRAFGAIQDVAAQLQVTEIFSKMEDQFDPSSTDILTQSAPIMVPVNPNATFKATVLT